VKAYLTDLLLHSLQYVKSAFYGIEVAFMPIIVEVHY
jgi:hypothetical protein